MQTLAAGLRGFMVAWSNQFPLDKWWRDKYNIPFNSSKHLEANQADILMEYIEHQLYEEHSVKGLENARKAELLKKGQWISKNEIAEEMSAEDFDKIEI